jgi:uncharacterized protein (TIGR03435 family)
MKKIFLIWFTSCSLYGYSQVKTGDAVPEFILNTIINTPVKKISLHQLKGQAVLIDFWATWCGSCIAAMPHLNQLQQQYEGKVQVLAVTDETVKRTRQFLAARPSNLWFAVDTGQTLNKYFPHRLIPHTVLISPSGTLVAITSPEMVTSAVIDSVLKGQEVHLPTKKDFVYTSVEDLLKTTFPVADTVKRRFIMEDELIGAPGLSTTYRTNAVWNGRRLSAINLTLPALYNLAYGSVPYLRTINNIPEVSYQKRYCVDVIAEQPDSLLIILQRALKQRFDIQAKMVPREKEVYVLKIVDTKKFNMLIVNTSGKRTYMANHGAIDEQCIAMTDFADFLESYGFNKIVLDETGSTKKYDIKFNFQPENPQSLIDILTSMGLKLEKQQREIEMLMLYQL